MRKANRNTSWISKIVAGVMVLQLAAPGIQGTAAAGVEKEGGRLRHQARLRDCPLPVQSIRHPSWKGARPLRMRSMNL